MITTPTNTRRYRSPEINIKKFGGVDFSTDATQIDMNRAADMLNMQLDTKGALQRFTGFKKAFPAAIDNTHPIRHLEYNQISGKFIITQNGSLYTFTEGNAPVQIYTGLTDAPTNSFYLNDKQYFINGTDYIQWDGTNTPVTVESVAYIPTTVIGRAPTGGGTIFEAVNLLTPKRKNSFIGNGSATVFQLDTTNLDADTVTAVVAGSTITEGSGLTVNRITGQVTFSVAPANGSGVDNVIVSFAKTVSGYANQIKNCTIFVIYGTGNNLRVFLSGNPNYKNRDWQSGLLDPTYFSDTGYTTVGSSYTAIKEYRKQQDACLIIKEDSIMDSTVWLRSVNISSTGVVTFPVAQGNASIGSQSSRGSQIIEDSPVIFSTKGVYRIAGNNIKDERNLQHISDNLEPNILNENNASSAISFDYDGKYGLAFPSGKVYVMDYRNKYVDVDGIIKYESYVWDNIYSSCFLVKDGYLYFGSSQIGMVYKINKVTDATAYSNDNNAYESYWYSKMMAMDKENFKKNIDTISATLEPTSTRSSVDLYYRTNKKVSGLIKQLRSISLDFNNIDFDDFTFLFSELPQTLVKQINADDVVYFQLILKNNKVGEGMTISNISIKYTFAGEI